MGSPALSKFQWGLEGTNGTAVVADTMLAGVDLAPVAPDRKPAKPNDQLGTRTPSSRAPIYQYLVQNRLRVPEAYFQILPVFLSCGLKGNITPSEVSGGQGDYQWDHTPSQTASNDIDSGTLEVGDDTQAFEIEYVMFKSLKMGGVIAQSGEASPVYIEGEYFGRQVTPTTFTGAISVPTMTDINGKLARIYIDSTWAGRGSTEKTSLLRAWELEIMTGVHPKFYGSANQYFDEHGEGDIDFMLALTFEGQSNADAQFDVFQAGTQQAVQIKLDSGVQIGTGTNHSFTISCWGVYDEVIPLAEQVEGNNLHTALLSSRYDPTGAQSLEYKYTTNKSAL